MTTVILGFEAAFAIVVTALIFTVVRFVEIHYRGDLMITHLTKPPYVIAMLLFAITAVENGMYIYVTNVVSKPDFAHAKRYMV